VTVILNVAEAVEDKLEVNLCVAEATEIRYNREANTLEVVVGNSGYTTLMMRATWKELAKKCIKQLQDVPRTPIDLSGYYWVGWPDENSSDFERQEFNFNAAMSRLETLLGVKGTQVQIDII